VAVVEAAESPWEGRDHMVRDDAPLRDYLNAA